ncbi:hypothetical protein CXP47_17370 [Pseudomonas chlororaphis]|uniref:Uncharacterized protein n=1 Tax=Pseudomonas chlororaphis TaxID=587753 RepID=A0AAP9VR39_9PSED|nr:hypothetical protein [Pseudomonas chlororaphis]AUG41586.1 hypothetical protein CXP47_17370 [Pseudomonas chlororaphis]QNR45444.1 hypothetical protein HLB40_17255 [Pseudomonas chlororaphis]
MLIQTILFFANPVSRTNLRRAIATAALLVASSVAPLQAASLSLEVELADSSIAYLDESTQARLWPQVWTGAELVAYYFPSIGSKGNTHKTRPSLQLFTCMVGTVCVPAPRFEMESLPVRRQVTVRAQVLQGSAGQPLKLRFELPETPAEHYSFSHAELRAPADVLWREPLFTSWARDLSWEARRGFSKRRKQPLSIALVFPKQDVPGYQMVDLAVRTPGGDSHPGDPMAVTTLRANLKAPDGSVRQMAWPGHLSLDLQERLEASPDWARTGRVPATVKLNQFPWRLSSYSAKERISTVVMPDSTPRWYGLKHYNAPKGVLLHLTQSGPLAQVELLAEAGAERTIEGQVPVKRETWLFFAGKLMRYRGQLHYGNGAEHLPDTEWRMDWSNGERLEASAANVSPSSLIKQVPDCRWDGCRKNLAEARAQLAASDAQLQSEGERYLQLAREPD